MIKWIEQWVKAENRAMAQGVPPYRPLSYWWCFPLQFLIIAMWLDSRLAVSWASVGWLKMWNSNGVIQMRWAKPYHPGTTPFKVDFGRHANGASQPGERGWFIGKNPDMICWLGVPYELLLAGFTVGWIGVIGVKRLRYQRQILKITEWEERGWSQPGSKASP